ncbi:hypothetical protein PC9H_000570 [Pleurotus ostreatus]|uniref:Uncharacterized protein n=1 Tax=Pleurotus ostreatus TaxID=5322 RepID=A0A8H7DZG6_PLEOS|nr:uncharacterized protein PC9H_000570 [Pleurotus ostreatus]KAF7440226.1 hypothetical protein PC9H_000570 [Pleurotus ostreatus]
MQVTLKFAALAFLAQAAVIAAFPLYGTNGARTRQRPRSLRSHKASYARTTGQHNQRGQWGDLRGDLPQREQLGINVSRSAWPATTPRHRLAHTTDLHNLRGLQSRRGDLRQRARLESGILMNSKPAVLQNAPQPAQPARPAWPKMKAGKRDFDELEARGPIKRPTQQECEVACTLAGHQGAAWNQCVSQCMASNYPTPPPSPHNRPAQPARPAKPAGRPAPKVKAGKREVEGADEE